jgi:hypothetical protein
MASAWGDSWGGSWGETWGIGDPGSIAGTAAFGFAATGTLTAAVVEDTKQGGVKKLNLRASFRGVETEEQKRLRREAQGIIKRIQTARPEESIAVQEEAEGISAELRAAIDRLEISADAFEQAMKVKQAQKAQKQALELQSLLIEAQLQAEILQQQVEEMDVAFVMFMLAAHL